MYFSINNIFNNIHDKITIFILLRPIVGTIAFNLNYITAEKMNFYNDVMTAVHELNHVLVFHDGLYSYFLNSNGYMRA